MTTSHLTKTFALILSLTVGIIGTTWAVSDNAHPLPDILTDIERHIGELTINIEKISDRIEFLRKASPSKDPLIQEVLSLDIRGWELHQEQWKLQLEHLQLTEGLLRNVQGIQKKNQQHSKPGKTISKNLKQPCTNLDNSVLGSKSRA